MSINIFEGARRITLLAAILWIVGWVWAAVAFSEPYLLAAFTTSYPHTEFVWSDSKSCDTHSARAWVSTKTKSGTSVHVTLCFLPVKADDGTYGIPYVRDPQTKSWWVGEKYSSEVLAYTSAAKAKFAIPVADEAKIDNQYWPDRLKILGVGALGAVGGLVALFAISWTIGWIIRGFLGIPRGQDHKLR